MRPTYYWAVGPVSMPDTIRIERAETAQRACELAFGRSSLRRDLNRGTWRAKNLGTQVKVIQSEAKRKQLLESPDGWIDPYKGDG